MKFDPWVAGIIGAFVTLIGVYTVFIYVAVQHSPQIEASYITEDR